MRMGANTMSRRFPLLIQGFLWSLLILSLAAFAQNLALGHWTLQIFDSHLLNIRLSFGLRFDWLSTLLFLMVATLGVSIGSFSIRFMAGDARQNYFFRYLLQTVLSVSFFVLSSNLLMLFILWLAVEYNLHRLLVIYKERSAAVYAAQKRLLIGYIGNAAFLAAVVLTYLTFGTFEFSEIFQAVGPMARSGMEATSILPGIGFLFAVAALLQSAQFPFHLWLPETMETPTPVSALMHAGIINAGGFLIIRMSPVLQYTEYALLFLASIGAISAVFGSLVMITQNDIKKKLAYSTISQMGLMLLACGLGAFSVALFHILVHSFYKATAFLSTGTLVEESKKIGFKLVQPSRTAFVLIGGLGLVIVSFGSFYQNGAYLAYFTYGAILLLGLLQNVGRLQAIDYPKLLVLGKIAAALGIALAVYLLTEYTLSRQVRGIVAIDWSADVHTSLFAPVNFAIYVLFALGAWVSARLMNPTEPAFRRLYIYLWNGAYLPQITTTWIKRISREKSQGNANALQ